MVTTIVPVNTAQPGWVTLTTGIAGGAGAFTVADAAGDMHVISVVLLTVIACDPTATAPKVADAW